MILSAARVFLWAACWLGSGVLAQALAEDGLLWTYTPAAVYAGDSLTLSLRASAAPTLEGAPGAEVQQVGEQAYNIQLPRAPKQGALSLTLSGVRHQVRFLSPGAPDSWDYHPGAGLRQDQAVVILSAQRHARDSDRRYALLRSWGRAAKGEAALLWPHKAPWGGSPLLASLASWRQPTSAPWSYLVIDFREELVGWDQYVLTASLAWIADDLQRQGQRVVLVQPPAPQVQEPALTAIRAAISTVAADMALDTLDSAALAGDEHWLQAPGVMGPWLNERGRAAFAALLQQHTGVAVRVPASGWIAPVSQDEVVDDDDG